MNTLEAVIVVIIILVTFHLIIINGGEECFEPGKGFSSWVTKLVTRNPSSNPYNILNKQIAATYGGRFSLSDPDKDEEWREFLKRRRPESLLQKERSDWLM